jgi:hypothetical protein
VRSGLPGGRYLCSWQGGSRINAEYNAGGSDKALLKIDEMDGDQLKQYLKQLVKDSIRVGIEILANGGKE